MNDDFVQYIVLFQNYDPTYMTRIRKFWAWLPNFQEPAGAD